jgi:hypothetical protein
MVTLYREAAWELPFMDASTGFRTSMSEGLAFEVR